MLASLLFEPCKSCWFQILSPVREGNPLSSPRLMRASLCCVADDLHEFGVEHPGDVTGSDTETQQRKDAGQQAQRHCLFDPYPFPRTLPLSDNMGSKVRNDSGFGVKVVASIAIHF